MKMTSAEAAKLLKKLISEKNGIIVKEKASSSFLASVGEDPESVRPDYDYAETRDLIYEYNRKIRKLKHAINLFNNTTVVPEYNFTIDELLVLIPQLSALKTKLAEMSLKLPKVREQQTYGKPSNIIDYRYANYDIDTVTSDLNTIIDDLSNAQLALDKINHSATFEVDI
ncbi:MAG: hypothetical protein MJ080_05790 [Clostridia bacterium]|nr:hypothetical protein [Clostridia bacterium]